MDPAAAGPVLLVPGYGGTTRSLEPLARALRAQGRAAVVVGGLGEDSGSLEDQAQRLDDTARAVLDDGAPSLDVVGYSAGGVLARVWLAGPGADVPVRRVVTLGSPHHGSDLASLADAGAPGSCSTACRQLAPGSDLLRSLPPTPGSPSWTSVRSSADEVVTPASTSVLRGALDVKLQAVCRASDVDHAGLARSPLAVALVVAALGGPGGTGEAWTQAPPASSCERLVAAGDAMLG